MISNNQALPAWARRGHIRQVRFDGGPLQLGKALEGAWSYLADPADPGFVSQPQALPVLTGLYSDDPEGKVAWLAGLGYTCIWVTFSNGYAPSDERPNQESLKRFAFAAHARGLHVTAYCSLTNVFWKSFFRELPEARDWLQQGPDGAPNLYGGQASRYLACINHPDWLEFKRQTVRLAVAAGADDIFWDNLFNRCYCPYCTSGFAAYSRDVLGQAHPIPRPRQTAAPAGGGPVESTVTLVPADDPVYAAWTAFVDRSVADAISVLCQTAKDANSAVLTSVNAHKARGVDAVCDLIWSEDGNFTMPRLDAGGIVSGVAQYRWGEAVGRGRKAVLNMLQPAPARDYWRICAPDEYRLAVAEGAAFGGGFVPMLGDVIAVRFAGADPASREALAAIRDYQHFLARHQELYVDTVSVADVAVYYSSASCARDAALARTRKPWEFALLALTEANVLAHVLLDRDAILDALVRYRVIVLAGVTCIGDEESERLHAFVEQGGTLVLSGEVGERTELWKARPARALAGLEPEVGTTERGAVLWREVGAGRCAAIAGLPEDGYGSMAMDRRDRLIAEALVAAVRQGRGRPPLVEVQGGPHVVANLLRQHGSERWLLHLLNFDRQSPVEGLTLRVAAASADGGGDAIWRAKFLSPDLETGDQVVEMRREAEGFRLEVPRLQTYGVVEIGPTRSRGEGI